MCIRFTCVVKRNAQDVYKDSHVCREHKCLRLIYIYIYMLINILGKKALFLPISLHMCIYMHLLFNSDCASALESKRDASYPNGSMAQ